MKLFTKYARINLLATIIIFLLASLAFYVVLRYLLIRQVDGDLKIEQHEIETYVNEHNSLPEPVPVKDQKISYAPATDVFRKKYSTVVMYDSLEKHKDVQRVLLFSLRTNKGTYAVTVAKSLERTNDLIRSILLITLAAILVILCVTFMLNRILLKQLWRPFYTSLNAVKNFRIDKDLPIEFPPDHIEEFSFMNETLQRATNQARQDYIILKEFTENASHEMQTPLSIIRSKLDLVIQHENLSEDQSKTMQGAYLAVEKLSRLNQSLLLLAKMGNNQYAETQILDLKQKLEEKIEAFHELWQSQNILVTASLLPVTATMNYELADILLNNLFSNATRHNFPGGFIRVNLHDHKLAIANSGAPKSLDHNQLFSRFYKPQDQGNNGLGLSIIKQICDISGFKIGYSFAGDQHSFIISLS